MIGRQSIAVGFRVYMCKSPPFESAHTMFFSRQFNSVYIYAININTIIC